LRRGQLKPSSLRNLASALSSAADRRGIFLGDPEWKGLKRWISREQALHPPTPAVPATAPQIAGLIAQADPQHSHVLRALWSTASRFGDLQHASIDGPSGDYAMMSLPIHKGDPLGRVGTKKWIPRGVADSVQKASEAVTQRKVTYRSLNKLMKRAGLTVHSARRGAATSLAKTRGIDKVALMTGHQSLTSARRYVDPRVITQEGQDQLDMADDLDNLLQ
jgi:hypothetical protein